MHYYLNYWFIYGIIALFSNWFVSIQNAWSWLFIHLNCSPDCFIVIYWFIWYDRGIYMMLTFLPNRVWEKTNVSNRCHARSLYDSGDHYNNTCRWQVFTYEPNISSYCTCIPRTGIYRYAWTFLLHKFIYLKKTWSTRWSSSVFLPDTC